jgi:hypothetical protein
VTTASVLAVTGTDILQNLVGGFALGAKYALIALGFVVVFRATGVINFANGSFVLVGAYMTYQFFQVWELNFYLAIVLAMVFGFLLGVLLEAVVLRRLVGEAPFTVIMVTIGLLFIIDNVVTAVWGAANLNLGDPWTGSVLEVAGCASRIGTCGPWGSPRGAGRVHGVLPLLLDGAGHAGHRHGPRGGAGSGHQRPRRLPGGLGHRRAGRRPGRHHLRHRHRQPEAQSRVARPGRLPGHDPRRHGLPARRGRRRV